MIQGHGGNIYELAQMLGCRPSEIVDMSSNMNPLGPPAGLIDFLKEHVDTINALPQVDAGGAVTAFAAKWGIERDQVLAGNGTTQFIYSIPRAIEIKKALIVGPTYADYADACMMHGVPYDFVLSKDTNEFQPDLSEISGRLKGFDTVFICNPNNPTGVLIPSEELVSLTRAYPNIRFIIDESYLPFVDGSEAASLIPRNLPNVIVLNSMSKIFRIPGLRIGFVVLSKKNVQLLNRFALPWSVNSLSQIAVAYLMKEDADMADFIKATKTFLKSQRQLLIKKFQNTSQIKFFPSTTSFMLAELFGGRTSDTVCAELIKHRILIRNWSNFKGLSDRFIRISLKTEEANRRLAEMLVEIVKGQGNH